MKKERKPYGFYQKQSDFIVKKDDPTIKAKITHWDYFYVERSTGYTQDNSFTATLLTPTPEGHRVMTTHCSHVTDADGYWEWSDE